MTTKIRSYELTYKKTSFSLCCKILKLVRILFSNEGFLPTGSSTTSSTGVNNFEFLVSGYGAPLPGDVHNCDDDHYSSFSAAACCE